VSSIVLQPSVNALLSRACARNEQGGSDTARLDLPFDEFKAQIVERLIHAGTHVAEASEILEHA
jgi:hypothetical protein